MKINKIEPYKQLFKRQNLKNTSKIITNPIKNTNVDNKLLNAGIGAISGMAMVKIAQNHKEETLKELKLNNETIQKILNVKNAYDNTVFDENTVNLLAEIADLPDKKMYHTIMSNIENVREIKKDMVFISMFDDELEPQYTMFAITKDGYMTATTLPESDSFIQIETINENENTKTIFKKKIQKKYTYEFTEKYKNDKRISIENVIYDSNKNKVTRMLYDGDKVIQQLKETTFDKNGVIDDKTDVRYQFDDKQKIHSQTFNKDFKHNAVTKGEGGGIFSEMTAQTRVYTNQKTGLKEKQILTPSEVAGVFNSTIIDEAGNKKIESIGKRDKEGNYIVEKNLESFDGTKTHYEYKASKDKNDIKTFYQIKDKDGKALTTVERIFKRVSPELAYSSINGHRYEIKRNGTHIFVTDLLNNEKTNIDLKELCFSPMHANSSKIFDKMSGDMLLDLYYRGYLYIPKYNINDFGIIPKKRIISVNDEIFTFSHEQGHTKDFIPNFKTRNFDNIIATDSEVQKAYKEERANFIKNMSNTEKETVDYFINKLDHYMGENGGAIETVAEINALLSTDAGAGDSVIWMRGYYLQKYFPKTIAAASRLLNPNSNLYVGKE